MRTLRAIIAIVLLLCTVAACRDPRPAGASPSSAAPLGPEVAVSPSPSTTAETGIDITISAEPESGTNTKTPPPIYSVEDVLSAAEASSIVGVPVELSADPLDVSDTGEASGTYVYDLPSRATIIAKLYIAQNGLISDAALKKGHDAKWAFNQFRDSMKGYTENLSGLGSDAFYVINNMEVHVLFQDYYILVAFVKDSSSDEANLALNKAIAAHIIDSISLGDVTLTED